MTLVLPCGRQALSVGRVYAIRPSKRSKETLTGARTRDGHGRPY